jgi:branched-chain amino acid transport system permease protein
MEWTGLLFYLVGFLIAGGIYAVLCLALNIQWGMGGLFNAGIAGFFAVGAYASAIVTTQASEKHLGGFGMPIPVGLAVAAIFAGLTGWAVAKICVRLKSDYLAMASIGIAEILRLVIVNESWLTNGSLGIQYPRPFDGWCGAAPGFVFLGVVWRSLPSSTDERRLHDSPWGGRCGDRDNEHAARAAARMSTVPAADFVIGAAVMGVAGGLSAHYFKFCRPAPPNPCSSLLSGDADGGAPATPRRHRLRARHLGHLVGHRNLHNRLPPELATRSPISACC